MHTNVGKDVGFIFNHRENFFQPVLIGHMWTGFPIFLFTPTQKP